MRIELKDIKKGDVFYECVSGWNVKMEALENARRKIGKQKGVTGELLQNGYACRVKTTEGKIEIYEHINPAGYGLRLYESPQYL